MTDFLTEIRRRRDQKEAPEVRQHLSGAELFRSLKNDIRNDQLIPIIGDAIRISHIFDFKFGQKPGGDRPPAEMLESADLESGHDVDPAGEKEAEGNDKLMKEFRSIKDQLNVTERLAYQWAVARVDYPLPDRYRIERVAQYHILKKKDSDAAKRDYLDFCKEHLLMQISKMPEVMHDVEEQALILGLLDERSDWSFGDIVDEMDFPRFPGERRDPIRILAEQDISYFLTTSFYDFIERELISVGKQPQSLICTWNDDLRGTFPTHPTEKPEPGCPVVYHLFGVEQKPETMVLSEDDHLIFLTEVARSGDDDGQSDRPGVIPMFIQRQLKKSKLLLMGYRLQDWDFRTLFHALLNRKMEYVPKRKRPGVAIHLEFDRYPVTAGQNQAEQYLEYYFKDSDIDVVWDDPDAFVEQLGG